MTTENSDSQELQPKAILAYILDLPNICSLAGLACTLLAIYFIILGLYPAAMIGMVWAVGFDWADGLVARRMKGRTGADRLFGGQLDLMIDVISYAVTPALLILSYGGFSPFLLPVVFVTLVCGVLRLSYFSIFGLSGGAKYTGLAIDNNSLFLVFLFLFEGLFSTGVFLVVLCLCGLGLAALNVSPIKTPKLSGKPVNVVILATYTVIVTAIYSWQML